MLRGNWRVYTLSGPFRISDEHPPSTMTLAVRRIFPMTNFVGDFPDPVMDVGEEFYFCTTVVEQLT